jgi:hypothetical protein
LQGFIFVAGHGILNVIFVAPHSERQQFRSAIASSSKVIPGEI